MNKLFNLSGSQIKSTFGTGPKLEGPQAKAVTNVGDHFTGIGTILSEGNVLPEHGEFAMQKVYEAKLAVDTAIAHGWNGGKINQY